MDLENSENLENNLLGKSKEEVQKYLNDEKLEYRIMREDNVNYMGTCDYNPDRLNLNFEKNILTKIYCG